VPPDLPPVHDDLTFLSPLSADRAGRLVRFVARDQRGTVLEHWRADHDADHPDADEVRDRAARQLAGYFAGYRGVLGMAYLGLVAV
jgi:hypothetical protein